MSLMGNAFKTTFEYNQLCCSSFFSLSFKLLSTTKSFRVYLSRNIIWNQCDPFCGNLPIRTETTIEIIAKSRQISITIFS